MAKQGNRNIIPYKKHFSMNLGIFIFAMIFLYLVYYLVRFLTATHVSVYEVGYGTIASDAIYEGLILREETVLYADKTGYINYYQKSGTKVPVGSYLYSIDETGSFYKATAQQAQESDAILEEAYDEIVALSTTYVQGYSDVDFSRLSSFRYDLEAALVDAKNTTAGAQIDDALLSNSYSGLSAYTAEEPGIITYYTDGYEDVTLDTLSADLFSGTTYEKNNFLLQEQVSKGDATAKLVTSELWYLVIAITEEEAELYSPESSIEVEFKKDGVSIWAVSSVLEQEDGYYLVLEFQNSMIRYVNDRFVTVELLLEETSGLKIPNSSLVSKEFLLIPTEYATKGGDSNSNGFLVEKTDEDGNTEITFVSATLFYEEDGYYYISVEDISLGDVVLMTDTNERYVICRTGSILGVYQVNRGYALFRRIEILLENESYTIVKTGTTYGLSAYDFIALDAGTLTEYQVLD